MTICRVVSLGIVDYQTGLRLQRQEHDRVLAGDYDGSLILLEHLPVITVGRAGGMENLCHSRETYQQKGVEVICSDRGGNVTCHNPGQLVGYPILNLQKWRQDVHWYVEMLEETIILTLRQFGLRTGRKSRYTGVWLGNKKIAAIGVSVKQWITGHGFALNITNDLNLFNTIVPCGIGEFGITSVSHAGNSASVDQVRNVLREKFMEVFHTSLESYCPNKPV